jgi:hypothetical protein
VGLVVWAIQVSLVLLEWMNLADLEVLMENQALSTQQMEFLVEFLLLAMQVNLVLRSSREFSQGRVTEFLVYRGHLVLVDCLLEEVELWAHPDPQKFLVDWGHLVLVDCLLEEVELWAPPFSEVLVALE